MIVVPPRHFVVIENPVMRNNAGKEEHDAYGQVKLRHGDSEVRFHQDPFALYPGEKIGRGGVQPLQVVRENSALRLRATRDFVDRYEKDSQGKEVKRRAGEEWLFLGLATYYPQSEEEIVQTIQARIIQPNQALTLQAREDCVDYQGKKRKAGEFWLVRREGAYLPGVNETDCGLVNATILTPQTAIHVQAKMSYTDAKGVERKSGEEWLVTRDDCEAFIPDVNEVILRTVPLIVLNHRQWCTIADPIGNDGKAQLGEIAYVRGPKTFFLKPGERLIAQSGVCVLSPNEALWVRATEAFEDHLGKKRSAGNKWLVYGPGEYWPPVQVNVGSRIRSFLGIEPLGLYFFQPVPFVATLLIILIAIFVFIRLLPSSSDSLPAPKKEL